MELIMRKGNQTVQINTAYEPNEDQATWTEVLDELVWPALRAFGYMIDSDFTDSLGDEHRQYIIDKRNNR